MDKVFDYEFEQNSAVQQTKTTSKKIKILQSMMKNSITDFNITRIFFQSFNHPVMQHITLFKEFPTKSKTKK